MPAKFKSKMTIPDYLIVYFKFLCTKKQKYPHWKGKLNQNKCIQRKDNVYIPYIRTYIGITYIFQIIQNIITYWH